MKMPPPHTKEIQTIPVRRRLLCQETPHCGAIDPTVFPDFDMKCLNLLFFPFFQLLHHLDTSQPKLTDFTKRNQNNLYIYKYIY
ncbi:hypothetical protein E2320_012918 [Naja naja]|nr:hypothetical protein E2320_012918 [Naja naja]